MKILFKIVCLIVLTSFIWSCDKKVKKVSQKFNTKITINFKNLSSKRGLCFQSYDTLPLKSGGIIKPPIHKVTETKNSIVYEFYLAKPRELLLGFSKFYIQPNDDFVLDYEVFKDNKYHFEDKFKIVDGNGVFLKKQSGNSLFYNPLVANDFFKSKNKKAVDSFLNITYLNNEAKKVISKMKLDYISKNKWKSINDYLTNYYAGEYLLCMISDPDFNKSYLGKDLQNYANQKIGLLIANYNNPRSINFNSNDGWFSLNYYLSAILNNKLQQENYQLTVIDQELQNFDNKAKQFLYLKIAESILKEPQYDKNNFKEIINSITYPPFKKEAAKFVIKNETGNNVEDNLKNISFFDTNLKPITFDKIFKNTSQKYLYFDFCGSWCLPCIKEIKEYSKTTKFDNSKNVRPIWIFFENDKTSWFKVIQKFNMKKENCFLIDKKDVNDFNKNFGRIYNWRGEFPHHSLFYKNGSIKDENPKSLEKLEEKDFR